MGPLVARVSAAIYSNQNVISLSHTNILFWYRSYSRKLGGTHNYTAVKYAADNRRSCASGLW